MFFLEFKPTTSKWPLKLGQRVCCIGSCFAEEMHRKLRTFKFDSFLSPFGTVYNPLSIFSILQKSLERSFDAQDAFEQKGIWYHWDTHSTLSAHSREALLHQIEAAAEDTARVLQSAQWLIVTFGTAFVYQLKSSGQVVANCHKVPGSQFSKSLLSPDQIVSAYQQTMTHLRRENPDLHVVLTVSPVRHIRDGLVENNHSKAILLQAVHTIVAQDTLATYFPAYELQMDVLRDYRFYKSDLIHPSEQAIDYIWKVFLQSHLDEKAEMFVTDWEKILKALEHKAYHPHSAAHQQFLQATLGQLQKWGHLVDTTPEEHIVRSQLLP